MKQNPIDRLTELFLQCDRALAARIAAKLKADGITVPQHEALGHMEANPIGLTMTEMAAKMGHTTAASTGLVDRLADLGMVARHPAPGDRRKITLALTPKAVDHLAAIRGLARDAVAAAVDGMSVKDLETFLRLCEMLAKGGQ